MRKLFGLIIFVALASGLTAQAAGIKTRISLDRAMFAAGCFWKTQHVFSRVPGVVKTTVGYSGGKTTNPSYKQVCSNLTGHSETVLVEYDPKKVTFHKLLEVFWSNHDPTTLNRQGLDIGTQYRSAIFYTSPSQRQEALAFKEELNKSHKFSRPIVTEILPAGPFYEAEEYHQNYYQKHGTVCF
jgi:peptide-methionine (S)-S-oxide reductase